MIFPRYEKLPYHADSTRFFEQLLDYRWPVFLDSGSVKDGRRYDIMAAEPSTTLLSRQGQTVIHRADGKFVETGDPFELLRAEMGKMAGDFTPLPFEGGAIGFFSYDLGRQIEMLPDVTWDVDHLPDMMVGLYDWVVVVDHSNKESWLIGQGRCQRTSDLWQDLLSRLRGQVLTKARMEPLYAVSPFVSSVSREDYFHALERIHDYILAGDCYQVNYTQRFSAPVAGDAWSAYAKMRELNPVPFGGFLGFDDIEVLSFSPERFLQLKDGHVLTEPIKGTRPRGKSHQADENFKEELKNSLKDRAENVMIVDLLRNDLGRVCQPGSIIVPELVRLESFPTVHHLVSRIIGKLRDGEDAISLLRACFPGGSVTGAPKIRAMEIIEELEPYRRGLYCGSIGYIGFNGDMDSNIVIRTLVHQRGQAHYWVGGGIVADSDPQAEYQECLDKAAAFRRYFEDNNKP